MIEEQKLKPLRFNMNPIPIYHGSPYSDITQFKIINGLYETNSNTPAHLLAGSIYGPSYISFKYALSFYGLIPEHVTTITYATFDKKKI